MGLPIAAAFQAQNAGMASIGGAAAPAAASTGLLSGIMGGVGSLAGPVGIAAGLLGAGGSGMFGGGGKMSSSSATSSIGSYETGFFNVSGGDSLQNYILIGVIILLVIVMARKK
jgi:hypothetical protein